MNEEILLTRKSPEVQGIIRVNFTEAMHCRGGGLQGTTRDDMECAIEEACRAQVARVCSDFLEPWLARIEESIRRNPTEWLAGERNALRETIRILRAAAGMEGGE